MAHTRGTLWALVTTLSCVLILALVIKFAGLTGNVIKPIAQGIKVISIFLGAFVLLRSVEKRAWMHGAILGLIYTTLAFFIFSIIDKSFSLTTGLLYETLFALAVGIVSALLIRLRRRNV